MFYAFQMNNGRWQVDAYTGAPQSAQALAFKAPSFDTRAQAEQWASDARAKLTPPQSMISPQMAGLFRIYR